MQVVGLRGYSDRLLANTGDRMLALVASALAVGDCIDAAGPPRAGGNVGVPSSVVKAPSTPGTFLRSSRWGHVRQLGRDCGSG